MEKYSEKFIAQLIDFLAIHRWIYDVKVTELFKEQFWDRIPPHVSYIYPCPYNSGFVSYVLYATGTMLLASAYKYVVTLCCHSYRALYRYRALPP